MKDKEVDPLEPDGISVPEWRCVVTTRGTGDPP